MGDVVNLRRVRKARARDRRAEEAAASRAAHGLTKAARAEEERARVRSERLHEGHRIEPVDD